jgi:hypothetical protein
MNLTTWARTQVSSKIRDVDLVKNEWIREIENRMKSASDESRAFFENTVSGCDSGEGLLPLQNQTTQPTSDRQF